MPQVPGNRRRRHNRRRMVVNPDCKNIIVWGANGETGEPPATWEQYYTQQGRGFGGSVGRRIERELKVSLQERAGS